MTTEALLDKQYIGQEHADELKQRMSPQQKPADGQKQDQSQSQKQEQNLKPSQKQKVDKPAQKLTRKQKIK